MLHASYLYNFLQVLSYSPISLLQRKAKSSCASCRNVGCKTHQAKTVSLDRPTWFHLTLVLFFHYECIWAQDGFTSNWAENLMCAEALIFCAYQISTAAKQCAPQSNLDKQHLREETTGSTRQMETQSESHKLELPKDARWSGRLFRLLIFNPFSFRRQYMKSNLSFDRTASNLRQTREMVDN